MFIQKLSALKRRYEEELTELLKELPSLPDGTLNIKKIGKSNKWFRYINQKQVIIPKKDRMLAESLAYKKYVLIRIKELKQKIAAIDMYVQRVEKINSSVKSSEDLLANPRFQDLLHARLSSKSDTIAEWQNASFVQNNNYPDALKHKCSSGNVVRSKSEAIIDMSLYNHQIPYRYECALTLNGSVIYPDFTIMHPKTCTILYWEHFGMMDNPGYVQRATEKIQTYASNGIIPDVQLITTFENAEHPLTMDMIEDKIQYFILN